MGRGERGANGEHKRRRRPFSPWGEGARRANEGVFLAGAMIIKVLGSAAGGGFPQVNCNCRNCADVRAGRPGLRARTQSSLAVSRDGKRWVLLNASPDLRQQLAATPELAPRPDEGLRSSPIAAVVLTNGDVDHVAGLLSLRAGLSFALYASPRVLEALAADSVLHV